jgi:hypothetical protein
MSAQETHPKCAEPKVAIGALMLAVLELDGCDP